MIYAFLYYSFSGTKRNKTFCVLEKCLHGSKYDRELHFSFCFYFVLKLCVSVIHTHTAGRSPSLPGGALCSRPGLGRGALGL